MKLYPATILFCFFCAGCGRAAKNVEHIKQVKVNMTIAQVEQIMGKPDTIFSYPLDHDVFNYMYAPPWGASDNLYIIFSKKDSLVRSINYGD